MRYFKYPYNGKNDKEIYKAELAVFDEHGKHLARKVKILGILASAVLTVVGITALVLLCIFAFSVNFPESDISFVNVLHTVAEAISSICMIFMGIILAVIIGALATGPFFELQTKAETAAILQRLKADNPPYSAPLIEWLENGEKYNGFFFRGI